MEAIEKNIFQIDSEIVKTHYEKDPNYKVVYNNNPSCDRSLCILYFSSNEIYFPNTEVSFKNSIVNRDKYEWQNSRFPGAFKYIFIRDIQKQWYIEGINSKINTPTELMKLILELTDGYKVYSIGSSAGGYAAIVYGSLLKAERVYAFNAQLNLFITLNKSSVFVDPLLYKYKENNRSKFYQVDNFLSDKTKYFYFQSALSTIDLEQYDALEKKNMFKIIKFKTSNHGFPFLRHNLSHVFSLSPEALEKLSEKTTHPFMFSVKIDGFFNASYLLSKAILKRLKKKLYDEKKRK